MNLFRSLTTSQNSAQTTKNATAALNNSTKVEVQSQDAHVDKDQFATSQTTLTPAPTSLPLQRNAVGTQSTYQMSDG